MKYKVQYVQLTTTGNAFFFFKYSVTNNCAVIDLIAKNDLEKNRWPLYVQMSASLLHNIPIKLGKKYISKETIVEKV